jgi:hypothetical protein
MRLTFARTLLVVVVLSVIVAAASPAKGTIAFKTGTVPVKFAFYVKGPDSIDPKTIVRRLIFSAADLTATLQKCATMSCADGTGSDAVMVDLVKPRLNFWMNLNNGAVQNSGMADPKGLTLTTDTPTRLAGRISFDATKAGGPKVDAEFDAPLLKEFTRAR